MAKKTKISKEDLDAFHEAMKGTAVIKHNKTRISPPPHKQKPSQPAKLPDTSRLSLNETPSLEPVQSEEFVVYNQSGISNKILRKLRKGQYNVDAVLDLHGMSVEQAKPAVHSFLQHCLHEGIRVALIIHGKGRHSQMPILKNKLNLWLREINEVLAFCSAAPGHGSRGAMYVLLKHNTERRVRG